MSATTMATTNALTLKLWAKKGWIQAMRSSVFGHAVSRGAIYFPPELHNRNATGDQITFSFVGKLTNVPLGEGQTADGNEEALELRAHSMAINVSRIPVLSPNTDTIEQQRTLIDFQETAVANIVNRTKELVDTSFLYQLAGADPTTITIDGTTYTTAAAKAHVLGHNPVVAPTSERIVRAGGVANDQSLGATNTMTLDLIDYALELSSRSLQPLEMLPGNTFDLYLAPEQIVDLMHDTSGRIQWFNISLAQITGGKNNYLENRFENDMVCVGKYRNVMIYEAPRVATGVNSSTSAAISTVRRGVLVGRNAASFASPFGGRPTDNSVPMVMKEMMKDYDYYKGQEGRLIYGLRKMTPAAKQDIGSIVISTFAAPHA